MPSNILDVRKQLLQLVPKVDANSNTSVATQEISKTDLPKNVKKVLFQAVAVAANSNGGQSAANVQRKINEIVDEFMVVAGRDGKLSPAELASVPDVMTRSRLKALAKLITVTPERIIPSNPNVSWPSREEIARANAATMASLKGALEGMDVHMTETSNGDSIVVFCSPADEKAVETALAKTKGFARARHWEGFNGIKQWGFLSPEGVAVRINPNREAAK